MATATAAAARCNGDTCAGWLYILQHGLLLAKLVRLQGLGLEMHRVERLTRIPSVALLHFRESYVVRCFH
jgi:hypothetical protein